MSGHASTIPARWLRTSMYVCTDETAKLQDLIPTLAVIIIGNAN